MTSRKNTLVFSGSNYFRQRVVLSILSGKAIEINDIRSNNDQPGLRGFEVNVIRLIDKISNGMTVKMNDTGTCINFEPGLLKGGHIEHDCGVERGIGYYLEILFMLAPFFRDGIKVVLHGITNNEDDPSVDSFEHCAIPLLKKFIYIGEDNIEIKIRKRAVGPNAGGKVVFTCPKIKQLKPVHLLECGKIAKIRGTVFSIRVSPDISKRIVEKSKGIFLNFIPDVFLSIDHVTGQRAGKSCGFGGSIYCESTTGIVLKSEIVSSPMKGQRTDPVELADKLGYLLLEEICRGGCVDSAFQSIICVYMLLQAKDLSKCLFGPLSPYTVQFLRHIKDFFGVNFNLEPYDSKDGIDHYMTKVLVSCVGIGYNKLT